MKGMRVALALAPLMAQSFGQSKTLYRTGFEISEGYDPKYTLAAQAGWLAEGTGGNGLVESFFTGMGQQAYIGIHPPTDTNEFTSVWKPVNIVPNAGTNIIKFSVVMQLLQSTAGGDDDFRWSIYSSRGARLLSLDFETRSGIISYILQNQEFRSTTNTFDFDGVYDLNIWLNFQRNLWTASLNNRVIANSETIASDPADLNLGDVDAVWLIRNPAGVGNNAMVFDDYTIAAEGGTSIPGLLEVIGVNEKGNFTFYVIGEKGRKYSVDVTSTLKDTDWFSLGVYENPTGTFRVEDTTSKGERMSFYRLREVP